MNISTYNIRALMTIRKIRLISNYDHVGVQEKKNKIDVNSRSPKSSN
jgi:hypothetical protein